MAKSKDDQNILNLIKQGVTEVIKDLDVVTRKDLDYLPSRSEFYEKTLKVLKGIEDLKDEKDTLTHQVSEHSDKIEKLEKIHPKNTHLATI